MYAIVTGASSGIGKAIALYLAEKGYAIATLSRNELRLNELKSSIEQKNSGQNHILIQGDLLSSSDTELFNNMILSQWGTPDLIVNCAGVYHTGKPTETLEADIRLLADTNFFGAFRLTQPWLKAMKQRGTGTIIGIGSIVSNQYRTEASAYTLSKQMLDSWMIMLADEMRESGVKVCRINPGSVLSPSWDDEPVEKKENLLLPEDIVKVIEMLLSLPPNSWMEELRIRPLEKNR